jgi:5'-nucleotidase
MNLERRSFLKKKVLLGSGLILANSINTLAKATRTINTYSLNYREVNIMFSSDLFGHVEPSFHQFGGLKNLHNTINNEQVSTLLFDAGGFLNLNKSSLDKIVAIESMNRVGYHAVNLSAADLKDGIKTLASLLPYMAFNLLSCNYHFSDLQMQTAVKAYQVLSYGKFKVGVTGVGEIADVEGLSISDPVHSLNKIASFLKEEVKCDLVICLSHLGFDLDAPYNNNKLAEQSSNVDLVIGGNASLEKSLLRSIKNSKKEEVLLGQNYSGAQSVAQVNFGFDTSKNKNSIDLRHRVPGGDQSLHVSESLRLLQQKHKKYNT